MVCDHVDGPIAHMFSNFTVVRLNKNETPPPWNSTAFLHGQGCADHPYVVESMERRKHAPYLVASASSILDRSSLWVHGVRWQDFSSNSTKYLRVIRDRPALIRILGEVFWRTHYEKQSCNDVDFVVYREVETMIPDCLTIHFLQGVTTTLSRGVEGKFGFRHTSDILQNSVPHPFRGGEVAHKGFCSFVVKFNSSHPTSMFSSPIYDIDAIVRHMFFLQLSEYESKLICYVMPLFSLVVPLLTPVEECERITDCPGGPYTSFECMAGYKFHITMENTMVDGYVSEKLFK